jgi:hypothetical protein
MLGRNHVSPVRCLKNLAQDLLRARATWQTRIAATIQQTTAALAVMLENSMQRGALVKVPVSVVAVRRVVDQIS